MIHSKENSIRHSFVYFRFFSSMVLFCLGRCGSECDFLFSSPSRFQLLCHCCSSYCLYSLRWLLTVTLWRYDCVYCKPKLFMRAAIFFCFSSLLALLDFFFGFFLCMELTSKNFVICLLQATNTILPN